jgi:Ca2+-transporting ATPase
MALAVEPPEGDLMQRAPRHPKESILSRSMFGRMMLVSAVMAVGALFIYGYYASDPIYARSATLTTLVFFQLFNLFNSRSSTASIFATSWTKNKWLLVMFSVASLLQLGALYVPSVAAVLGLTALDWSTLGLCLMVASSIVLIDEGRKLTRVMMLAWVKTQTASN